LPEMNPETRQALAVYNASLDHPDEQVRRKAKRAWDRYVHTLSVAQIMRLQDYFRDQPAAMMAGVDPSDVGSALATDSEEAEPLAEM
jgi:hypothetical protein